MSTQNKFKHDWYQTDSQVVISILAKNQSKEKVAVEFSEGNVSATIKISEESDYNLDIVLCHPVIANESSYRIFSSKVEIKLKKLEAIRWPSLEGDGLPSSLKVAAIRISDKIEESSTPTYPSSALRQKDWNAVEVELKKQELEDKPEGEEALNQMFQKIYGEGSDEVKKAMKKSFSQSGGTVLSTNWNEISQKDVEVKAPDGMEWKTWEN